jgi:PRTRC genetic system ThiF family protein
MEHAINPHLLQKTISVALVGAGGTGSQAITALAQMHYALVKLGHPGGLHVTVYDDDRVSESNIGRQWFFPADLGQYKADVLVQRVNMTMGTDWTSCPSKVSMSDTLHFDIVIGAVDTRMARLSIMRAMERGPSGAYYLDFGNRAKDGQAILGQVVGANRKTNGGTLPHVGELFPEVMDPKVVDPDEGPSCSLAEALARQSLFINRTLVSHGMAMLWDLLRHHKITFHGVFVNLETGRVTSLPVCEKAWARFGYGVAKSHIRLRPRTPVPERRKSKGVTRA